MITVTLPGRRVRVRRIRPPSGRVLFWTLTVINNLGWIAMNVVDVTVRHDLVFGSILVAVWSILFTSNYATWKRELRRSGDDQRPPIDRRSWNWLAAGVGLDCLCWMTI